MELASYLFTAVEFIAHLHCATQPCDISSVIHSKCTVRVMPRYDVEKVEHFSNTFASPPVAMQFECNNVILCARNRHCRATIMQCECAFMHFNSVSSMECRHYYACSDVCNVFQRIFT